MGYGQLRHTLMTYGVITSRGTLDTRCTVKLRRLPELLNRVVNVTCFLRYDASIRERLHCIIADIWQQPTCKACGAIVKMRTSGRQRFTFPDYCSSRCSAGAGSTKDKRSKTNIEKYGVDNPMKR